MLKIFVSIILFFLAPNALAADMPFDMEGGAFTAKVIQLILAVTILSLAPSILIMVTSFTRIIVILSFLRSAIGLQQTPPNTILISLALFLTLFIMKPVFDESYNNGILPLIEEKITEKEALPIIAKPFHKFMITHTRDKDIELFMTFTHQDKKITKEDIPYQVLIPAFMISELRRAFEIGFLLYLPFLIIDMLVASILMAMGMMMLPPVVVSLPFKLIFFVISDGWYMISGSLIRSYGG
ncbi:MAG: flagellar type III secretion system pore protein FliP [Sphingobacteriia bacterium]|nr:flagellar type III secretion system pore protein FliP [Sphingobacteriia bacterium]